MKMIAAVCLLALAGSALAQTGTFEAKNVVATWADCPNKKPTEWDPKVFDSSLDSLTQLTEFTKQLTKPCQDSLLDLAGCASDNDAFAEPPSTTTSLSTVNGCCLKDCSDNIKKVIKQGCFDSLLKVICSNPKASAYKTGLFNAGVRCADFNPVCPTGDAAVANVTAAVKEATVAAVNATKAAATEAVAATKDAAKTAVADITKKVTGAAGSVAASAVMAVAGAAALLAL